MKKFLSKEKMIKLQEIGGFLDNYYPVPGIIFHIGPDIDTIDTKLTGLLRELGEVNAKRKELINKLLYEP
jgi:hypothetical protein